MDAELYDVAIIGGWFWLIPLTAERTSIGVVLDSDTFKKSKLNAEDFLEQALAVPRRTLVPNKEEKPTPAGVVS